MRREKIAISEPAVAARGGARGAAEHHLVAHEFTIVFAESPGRWTVAGVTDVRAGRPLPDVAIELAQRSAVLVSRYGRRVKIFSFEEMAGDRYAGGGRFPLGLRWQARAGPAREGIGFVEADMTNGLVPLDGPDAGQRKKCPLSVLFPPVERRLPTVFLACRPAIRKPELGPLITPVGHE